MGASENKALIREMYRGLTEGHPEAFLAALADDVRWTIIGNTIFSKAYVGKQQLIEGLFEPFSKQIKGSAEIEPRNLIAEGDFVAMQAQGKARTVHGKDYNNTYCHVFRIRGGKVVEATEYLDTELVTEAFRP